MNHASTKEGSKQLVLPTTKELGSSGLVSGFDVFVFVGGKGTQTHVHFNHHTATVCDSLNQSLVEVVVLVRQVGELAW